MFACVCACVCVCVSVCVCVCVVGSVCLLGVHNIHNTVTLCRHTISYACHVIAKHVHFMLIILLLLHVLCYGLIVT